jgi:hypothetical protein
VTRFAVLYGREGMEGRAVRCRPVRPRAGRCRGSGDEAFAVGENALMCPCMKDCRCRRSDQSWVAVGDEAFAVRGGGVRSVRSRCRCGRVR